MTKTHDFLGLLVGGSLLLSLTAAGPAAADEAMSWSYATAHVGSCIVGVTCGVPGGVRTLGRERVTENNSEFTRASIVQSDYQDQTLVNFGQAFASAQAGDGALGLPVLKAYASGGGFSLPDNAFVPAVNFAAAHAIQGYTNTGETALIIPLNAFQGLVDYLAVGAQTGGRVGATLAVTTSAILDPLVSAQYFQAGTGPSASGQWTGTCGSTGALAMGTASVNPFGQPNTTQFLSVAATSCTGATDHVLNPGESFYVWATLGVLRSGFGVTDASNTFNVTIAPQFQSRIETELAPNLALADGSGLNINVGVVPEPSTWAMMIIGFGAAGSMIRRRKAVVA